MAEILPVDSTQNAYANNPSFKLASKEDIFLLGRKVQKLTYRDSHTLLWKIVQVAIDVAACCLLTYVDSEDCIFRSDYNCLYTRCQEVAAGNKNIIVGAQPAYDPKNPKLGSLEISLFGKDKKSGVHGIAPTRVF